ncbi:MAG: hypothetical protein AAF598_17430 [Bacteroidota bacterium]
MFRTLPLFLFGILLISACRESTIAPKVPSGWYGEHLQVAFHPVSKELSAIYSNPAIERDSCPIYLVGKMLGPKANLISWQVDKRKHKAFGIVQYEENGQLSIVLEADLNPCHEVQGFEQDHIRTFQLSEAESWIRIQTVKRASTVLRAAPNSTDSLLTLQRYDIVRTLQQQADWVQVSVPGDSIETLGWLPIAHLRRFPG